MESKATPNDCFTQLDEAFAVLAAELNPAPPTGADRTVTPAALQLVVTDAQDACAFAHVDKAEQKKDDDLAFYEEAFDRIDALLASAGDAPAYAAASLTAPSAPPILSDSQLWRPRSGGSTPLERLLGTLDNLSLMHETLGGAGARSGRRVSDAALARVVDDACEVCAEFGFSTARVRAEFAREALNEGPNALVDEISQLIRHIRHDSRSSTIRPIASDRLWALNLTLGETAAAAFPAAEAEIAEGGRCFAMERYSACVFHMLRAAEQGVGALGDSAGAPAADAGTPVDWMALLGQIEAWIAAIDRAPVDREAAAAVEFFRDVLRDARELHRAARQLADPATGFEESEAKDVCQATRGFLMRLSAQQAHAPNLARLSGARSLRTTRKGAGGAIHEIRDVAADSKRS